MQSQQSPRRGVWLKVLDSVERGILSLAARVVDRVESVVLGVELLKIIKKLRNALKSEFIRHLEGYGVNRVRVLSNLAFEWGNKNARIWVSDIGFTRYVTLMKLNRSNLIFE
ncbi:hypothetical protein MCGE09_00643 [Thaumarchaeota archaeon SCGC AB-539-E09]|nr:hypothetical protein MCGE09_00643 [Thaumarchaeota archaeon SCGC AB-539-E09]